MSDTYVPCAFKGENGLPCETWFPYEGSQGSKLCIIHRSVMLPTGETQNRYIDVRNDEMRTCDKMTLDELEVHIAGIEAILAEQRNRMMAAQGVRRTKIEALSEAERDERRKYVVTRAVKAEKTKVDPAKKFMATVKTDSLTKLGLDKKNLMSMDIDALIAKFEKGKET